MSSSIVDRFILVLRSQMTVVEESQLLESEGVFSALWQRLSAPDIAGHGFWAKLDERTGIPALSLRNAYFRRQRPTAEMLEAVARQWPRYAFWLTTGITDAANGHVAPLNALTFPERLYAEDYWGNEYFRAALKLQSQLFKDGRIDTTDDEKRFTSIEREGPRWKSGKLLDTAYKISRSNEYADLIALWSEREKDRASNMGKITGHDRPWERKPSRAATKSDLLVGLDSRISHQSSWDLFYKPKPDKKVAER